MKNRFVHYTTALLSALLVITAMPLSAMSVGREGTPYMQDGIQWQPVYIKDDNGELNAALPGDPHSGFSDGWFWVASEYNGGIYDIKTPGAKFTPPKTLEVLLAQAQYLLPAGTTINVLESIQPAVRFVLECLIQEDGEAPRILRIYTTDKLLFVAAVQDEDLTLSEAFFKTINVIR